MKKIRCHLDKRSYPAFIGRGLLSRLSALLSSVGVCGKVLVVTNRKIYALYYPRVRKALAKKGFEPVYHLVPDSEDAKSQKELFKIYRTLLQHRFDRYSSIIALGGGIVGDVAGFAAATYMRGITFITVPTTLLAQVDSALGGKTGINLEKGKNLVGAFYQPRCVVSDVSVLKTLSASDRSDSLSEVIKYGVIWDKNFFTYLEKNIEKAIRGNLTVFEHIVAVSTRIKLTVVEEDEKETTGLRAILNFGHTFAHGFEAAGRFTHITHGAAVGLGMVAAARLACTLKMFSSHSAERIQCLVERIGLVKSLTHYRIRPERVLSFMYSDKKNKGKQITLVLPTRIGQVKICTQVSPQQIKATLRSLA